MPLHKAAELESKNMPTGAHLVVANSTETIIPRGQESKVLTAAGGLNLDGLAGGMDKFTQSLNSISQMADQVGGMGGILGGAQGNLGLAMAIARQMGLIITSTTGGRHAPGSYHYAGRAVDVSNGVNTREQMAFARRMASQFGASIKELFYDPLGWSIKNGRRAPYTIGGHSDHVHVAFNKGNLAPLEEEMAKMPSGAKLGYANTSELVANRGQTKMLAQALNGYNVLSREFKGLGSSITNSRRPVLPVTAARPISRPATINQPAINPLVNQPVVTPFVNQPAVNPTVNQPIISPLVNQPVINPFVNQPTINPPAIRSTPNFGAAPVAQSNNAGTTTINAPITINALPGQDPSDIADVILLELDRRVSRTRSSSLFFS
jgi:hypothetical protein